tara:strand:+ start:128 stop:733 length:606 start_codon:yes stop_codon:yes gene_type:complete
VATATAKKKTTEQVGISIPQIAIQRLMVKIVGDSPLITHAWAEKAIRQIKDKQAKKATKGKEARDPEADYQAAFYRTDDGVPAMPSVAFKSAAVSACRDLDMKMTEARGRFHVEGELIEIIGEPRMREDMVRVGMGTADIRYRPEFVKWSAILPITYNSTQISPEQIINLLNVAGFGVGVGEWRPEKNGQYGRFHVASDNE